MEEEDAKQLVREAIRAGIFNDMGSGSNVDLVVIKANDNVRIIIVYRDNLSSPSYVSGSVSQRIWRGQREGSEEGEVRIQEGNNRGPDGEDQEHQAWIQRRRKSVCGRVWGGPSYWGHGDLDVNNCDFMTYMYLN